MNFAKKIISVVLCLAISFSAISVIASAVDSLRLGEKYTVSIENKDEKYYSFIASDDGVYEFTAILNCDGCVDVEIDANDSVVRLFSFVRVDEYVAFGKNEHIYFYAEKGMSFNIKISDSKYRSSIEKSLQDMNVNTSIAHSNITFSISKANLKEVSLGDIYEVTSMHEAVLLVPKTDGYYNFKSLMDLHNELNDPEIAIDDITGRISDNTAFNDNINEVNSNVTQSTDNDTDFESDSTEVNFDYTQYLQAGHIYIIELFSLPNSLSSSSYNYKMQISDGANIEPKYVDIQYADMYIDPGMSDTDRIEFLPTGARYNVGDVIVTSSDESVATAYYDAENSCIKVNALKGGTVTITFKESNAGVTGTINVHVNAQANNAKLNFFEKIILFFEVLFITILHFFS
jgi:hypothetical protein